VIGPWLSLGSIDGDGSAEPVLVTCTEALALKDWLRITCVIGVLYHCAAIPQSTKATSYDRKFLYTRNSKMYIKLK